jgi:YYY domain-containing protein
MASFMRDILAWALATEIAGLAVLPLLRSFFGNRRDAAFLSRPIGLAAVAYLSWCLSLWTPIGFTRLATMLSILALAAVSWVVRRRSPAADAAAAPLWGDEERLALILFWSATGIFLLIRAAGPAILGAEKFMDLAFLNSLARFSGMPPADPWMAGKTINYYYWGYLLAATQAKLSGVAPLTAYNLAVATFAGFSFVASVCLGLRLSRGDLGVGLASGVATVFAGNFAGAFDAWNNPFAADFDYWHASRVIAAGNTINEFPFFTFFHADLHPHLLAFPYFIAAFAVAQRWLERQRAGWREWPALLLVAFVAGTARAASLWNMPAMGILLAACGALAVTRGERLPRFRSAVLGGLVGLAVFVVSIQMFRPYNASFHLEEHGLGRTTMFSGILEFLGVWGILFAVAVAGLWPRPSADDERSRRMRDLGLTLTAALCLLLALALRAPALSIVFFLALLALSATWRSLHAPEGDTAGVFAGFLLLLGLGMIAGCELIYFKDNYGAELQRMNTIFKFYHQAWPLLAVGGSVFAGRAWFAGARKSVSFRLLLASTALAALLWPINVAVSRFRQRDGPFSLDARGPLARRNPGDASSIDWLLKNAPAGSVVLEATGDPYSEFARISSHTGIPTVLGWANHEGLWRANDPEVAERAARVNFFYTEADPRMAWETIQKYRVTHVVLGDLERRTYPSPERVARLPFLAPGVSFGTTTVFRVAPGDGQAPTP